MSQDRVNAGRDSDSESDAEIPRDIGNPGVLLVTLPLGPDERSAVTEAAKDTAEIVFLSDLDEADRRPALRRASALISRNLVDELRPEEFPLLRGVRLLQFVTAGIDFIPLDRIPAGVPMATNGGAYAEPMAEHAVMLALAGAKRLLVEHRNLSEGRFNQFVPTRMLAGGVCGIFGFGGIGIATAKLMRCFGMHIHAVNRSGRTTENVDWIGPPALLDTMLAIADVLVISAPLTSSTHSLIGRRELDLMKKNAILVNLARGEIIDQDDLYEHLVANAGFTACLDAWWVEPSRHGRFSMSRPFLDLPNVVASPHNSASASNWRSVALGRAAANCRRALLGQPVLNLVSENERSEYDRPGFSEKSESQDGNQRGL